MPRLGHAVAESFESPRLRRLSPLGKTAVAVATYALWTVVTWFLEGRIRTLLRPEATGDRLVYTGVANVLVGTVFALWLVREFVASGFLDRSALGFQSVTRTLVSVVVAGVLGAAVYLLQRPPTTDPVVVVNAFAQVLPVSIAELVVCWVVVGGCVEALLRERGVGRTLATGGALVASSVCFGLYHVAHSPPFNSVAMVVLLSLVGVGTGLFYFGGRSAYGALVFHNTLALFGVTTALAAAGQLGAYRAPVAPVLVTGLVALVVFVGVERCCVRLVDASSTHAES